VKLVNTVETQIAILGECMLELTRSDSDGSPGVLPMNLSYGGDTLNVAVYLARLGGIVEYVTGLGDDVMSDWLIEQWRAEGVGCRLVARTAGSTPGLYLINTDELGERSFLYWRDSSPARRLLSDQSESQALFEKLCAIPVLFMSGITLAIYDESARRRLFSLLADYRQRGGKVVFDGNFRPKLWDSADAARDAYIEMYKLTDIALPTLEDEQQVFGDLNEASVVDRLQSYGVREVVVKLGAEGCLAVTNTQQTLVRATEVDVVDTTSAGDSFNAGYLSARLVGKDPITAAHAGHQLASTVIQYKGAIIPRDAMPKVR